EASMSRMGKKIIELQNVSKSFDDTVILDHFNYSFNKGDRIGIVGPNGTGKTTFLNILTQEIKADNGAIDTGETIVFGYYKQEFPPIPEDKKVIDVVREIAEYMDMGDGRKLTAFQLLQQFLFSKKMQHAFVRKLSGGEKRRLHLLTILMKSPNFLILDEPTNDLDILTLSVLEAFLKSFQGCLITVTHDRYFLDKLVNHLFVFEGEGKVVDFNGTYSEYRQQKKNVVSKPQKSKSNEEPKAKEEPEQPPKQEKHQKKLSYKEQLRLEEIEKNLETLEQRKEALESQLNQAYADGEQLNEWSKELQDVLKQIEEQEQEWFELSEMAE
ncbi:MAG: ABC transporter, partial [Bacteroidetes bacterium SW_10_40_5]